MLLDPFGTELLGLFDVQTDVQMLFLLLASDKKDTSGNWFHCREGQYI